MHGKSFAAFMGEMLEELEKKLHAPSGSFIYLKDSMLTGGGPAYSYREIPMHGVSYYIGFRVDWPVECEGYRFLLNLVAEEVCDIVFDAEIFRENGSKQGDRWAFDYAGRKWHTAKTLAAQIYERICYHVFPWISRCLGIDPLSLSHIADMAYEADTAEGTIIFQTGDLDSRYKTYRIHPYQDVYFSPENERFVRKQLAGAGANSLLFVRANTDHQAQYTYKGYLVPPENDSDRRNLFVSVLLKRGGNWVLQISGKPMLQIQHRDVFLPEDDLSLVKESIDNEFGAGTSQRLSIVLDALHEQKHGTSVIFLNMKDRVSQEMMARLEKNGRALRIEDIHINGEEGRANLKESLESISRIDGALICDLQTMSILYVNVIVDGLALTFGRRDCGARHNALESAIVNLAHQDKSKAVKALAVIFSEDGGISSFSASQGYKLLERREDGSATGET